MGIEFYKLGRGLLPASEEAEAVHHKMTRGEILTVKVVKVRDIVAHRRYWALMTLCAENCERIEIAPGRWMPVHSKDDIHTAVKLCTGYFDTIFDANNRPMARIVKSTSFDEMTPDQWEAFWPRVLDIIQERIIPGIQVDEAILELQKCMGVAA